MSARLVVAVIIGTRPEAIKLAPVVMALRAQGRFEPLVVSTGQHRQMLDQALEVFELRPDVDLEVMTKAQSLHELTARTLERLRSTFHVLSPSRVIVQGDTTTAFAAALAAFYARVPVAHVEAGLRSGDRYEPFPEEINRRMVDQLSDLLFAPTGTARDLLVAEGFPRAAIHLTGNTVVDALLAAREVVRRRGAAVPGVPAGWLDGHRLVLVTAHRRESFGERLEAMCRAMLRIVRAVPDARIIYPVHLNPSVDGPVRRLLGAEARILLLPPVSYLDFVALMDRAHLLLTDSGGVQEEAPTFGKPLLVMREVTERPEGIDAGVARLVGTSEERIVEEALHLLLDPAHHASMSAGHNPYGDGRAAERIAAILAAKDLGAEARPIAAPAA